MECPECKRTTPENSGRCLYCGASLGTASGNDKDSNTGDSKNAGGEVLQGDEEISYVNLADLPENLRKQVEEELKKGKGEKIKETVEETTKSWSDLPEEKEEPYEWEKKLGDKDLYIENLLQKTPRRIRLSSTWLSLVALVSALLAGFIVWLAGR